LRAIEDRFIETQKQFKADQQAQSEKIIVRVNELITEVTSGQDQKLNEMLASKLETVNATLAAMTSSKQQESA
jgi:hypothetical protein